MWDITLYWNSRKGDGKMSQYKEENEQFTIENFIDGVNEVLLQTTDNYDNFSKIEKLSLEFIKGNINIDQLCFEFAMLIKEKSL